MKRIVRTSWLGVVGFTAIAVALSGNGCGGDDTGSAVTPGPDAQVSDAAGGQDATTADTGTTAPEAGVDAKSGDAGGEAEAGADAKASDAGGEAAATAEAGADAKAGDAGPPADGSADAKPADGGSDATVEAGPPAEAGATDSGCSGATPVALKVANYLNWCSVSIAGGAATTAATQTVCVASGAVTLVATAASATFELGPAPWHDTVGDHDGSGDPGQVTGTGLAAMSTTMVDVSGTSACAWVCCPLADGSGCAVPDQCP